MSASPPHAGRRLTIALTSTAIIAVIVALTFWLVAPDPVSQSAYDRIRLGMTQAELRSLLTRSPDYESRELGLVRGPENYTVNMAASPATLRSRGFRDYRRQQWQSAEITITVISDPAGHVVCRYKGGGQPRHWLDHARLWIARRR